LPFGALDAGAGLDALSIAAELIGRALFVGAGIVDTLALFADLALFATAMVAVVFDADSLLADEALGAEDLFAGRDTLPFFTNSALGALNAQAGVIGAFARIRQADPAFATGVGVAEIFDALPTLADLALFAGDVVAGIGLADAIDTAFALFALHVDTGGHTIPLAAEGTF